MKDLIKVRIDKCSTSMFWWYHQIGSQINVEEHPIDKSSFKLVGLPQTIKKSDCTVLSDTGEKDEPKEFVLPKKWYFKFNGQRRNDISKWREHGDPLDAKYICSLLCGVRGWGIGSYSDIPQGYAEITQEQFFTHVWEKEFGKPHEIPAPEPKGYCIKRTPENAEVLNKWMNSIDWKLRYDRDYGYVISETSDMWGMVYDEIPEGFTELFTVEEFFEKVNYKPESVSKENLHTEPVLIAKAGDKVRIVDFGEKCVADFTLNKEYVLEDDLYVDGVFNVIADDKGEPDGYTSISKMKFEKVSAPEEEDDDNFIITLKREEQVKEESERIPFDLEKWKTGKFDVVQRNGLPAEILKTDLDNEQPIVVAYSVGDGTGKQGSSRFNLNGGYNLKSKDDRDLFLLPKTETVWVNVYHGTEFKDYDTARYFLKSNNPTFRFQETIEVKRPIK